MSIRDTLYDRSERYCSISAAYRPINGDRVGEHRALVLAALNRDADQATALIEHHIRCTSEDVLTYAKDVLSRA